MTTLATQAIAAMIALMGTFNNAVNGDDAVSKDSNSTLSGITLFISEDGKDFEDYDYAVAIDPDDSNTLFLDADLTFTFEVDNLDDSSHDAYDYDIEDRVIVFDEDKPERMRACDLNVNAALNATTVEFIVDCDNGTSSADKTMCTIDDADVDFS